MEVLERKGLWQKVADLREIIQKGGWFVIWTIHWHDVQSGPREQWYPDTNFDIRRAAATYATVVARARMRVSFCAEVYDGEQCVDEITFFWTDVPEKEEAWALN